MSPSTDPQNPVEVVIHVDNERVTIRELIIASTKTVSMKDRIVAVTELFQYLTSKPDVLQRLPELTKVCRQKIVEFRQRMEEHAIDCASLEYIADRQASLTTLSSDSRSALQDAINYSLHLEHSIQKEFEVLAEQMNQFEMILKHQEETS